ncbi:MAG: DUF98 domain-containing protein [bacterium]|nr:DUF98 domain-containing protein [bacterium]
MSNIKNNVDPKKELEKLLTMEGSTTAFLEKLAGKKLNVSMEFQKEIHEEAGLEIVRLVKLYFDDPQHPVILAITSLPKATLTQTEIRQIKDGSIPIGKIFGITKTKQFRKSDITMEEVSDRRLAKKLNVADVEKEHKCFKKEYTLWVKDRKIGVIKEIFTEQSFLRIWR